VDVHARQVLLQWMLRRDLTRYWRWGEPGHRLRSRNRFRKRIVDFSWSLIDSRWAMGLAPRLFSRRPWSARRLLLSWSRRSDAGIRLRVCVYLIPLCRCCILHVLRL
jgi:hypothetical protein